MPDAAKWRFRRMERAELNTNPVEGEFFTPQGIADALVRESIQNSLDASLREPGDPVRVRFRFSEETGALEPSRAGRYIAGLRPHLAAQRDLEEVPAESAPLPYLAIEDFGTRGLSGDPLQEEDREAAQEIKNHFYYFWRNIGRSAKEEKDLGRWGLGKTVFPATSQINSFFGLTLRADDRRRLLMGQSVLTIHKIDHDRRSPYGYFARFAADDDFALPVEDPDFLAGFCSDFELQRGDRPGLSVVIPFPDPELNARDIARAAIVQYFYPIVARELEVEVIAPDRDLRIDAESIAEITRQLGQSDRFKPDVLQNLYVMAHWAQHLPGEERIVLEPTGMGQSARWSESLFPHGVLEDLQRKWEHGHRIALRGRVPVRRSHRPPVIAAFDMFLQRDEDLERAEEHYVRQGITIPGIRLVRERTARCLLVVSDAVLSALLGDSENPAHTDWIARRPIIKKRYDRGASSIGFVKNALREIVRMLNRPPEGRDENLLHEIFFLEVEPEGLPERAGGKKATRQKRKLPAPKPPPEPRSQPLRLEKRQDGFEVSGNPDVVESGDRVLLRAAYRVRRGDPFTLYSPYDFQFGTPPIQIEHSGVGIERADENRIELRIDEPAFHVTIRGFDPRRDLVVSARRIREST